MPAQLMALSDGPSILLDKPILLLGRHPECDIQIDSRKISRRHCCIAQVSDYLVVRDLGSTNGIRINGVRVVEGRLVSGDELTIANNRYKVTWEATLSSSNSVRPTKKPNSPPPSPLAGIEDELLESCEEPVPLDEPGPVDLVVRDILGPKTPPRVGDPVILPDEPELLPNSDVFPRLSPHPPEFHPPA